MVIRNPYDSFKADFNREMSSTHTGQVDQAIYNSTEWENFIRILVQKNLQVFLARAKRWASSVSWFPKYAKEVGIPIKILFYENLIKGCFKNFTIFFTFFDQIRRKKWANSSIGTMKTSKSLFPIDRIDLRACRRVKEHFIERRSRSNSIFSKPA